MLNANFSSFSKQLRLQRGFLFGALIVGALLAFELFNYSTTDFALSDLLGDLKFMGIAWATILAIAFCGIDFAGIARLFTPEQGRDEPAEVWYLFGAWLLAAAMNATLTWWGVSVAMARQPVVGSAVVSQATLIKGVPIFVALMVWVTRVLIIGAFSIAGERIFSMANTPQSYAKPAKKKSYPAPKKTFRRPATQTFKPAPKTAYSASSRNEEREIPNEPTYHPIGMTTQANIDKNQPPWR